MDLTDMMIGITGAIFFVKGLFNTINASDQLSHLGYFSYEKGYFDMIVALLEVVVGLLAFIYVKCGRGVQLQPPSEAPAREDGNMARGDL